MDFANNPYEHLFVPDILSSSQFLDMHKPTWRTPETKLWLAVLKDAINLYLASLYKIRNKSKRSKRAKRILEELEDWITEPIEKPEAPLPYHTICVALEINPDWLRTKIFGLKTSKHLPKQYRSSKGSSNTKLSIRKAA